MAPRRDSADPPDERVSDAEPIQEFCGIYRPHWEVGHLEVQTGRGFLGRPKHERWEAWFPAAFEFPDPEVNDPSAMRFPTQHYAYRMVVRGRVGPRGHFGHRGWLQRRLDVIEVLECTRLPPVSSG